MKTNTLKLELTGEFEHATVIHAPQLPRDFEFELKLTQENAPAVNHDLTLDICGEDGSRTRFYQNDEAGIIKVLQHLIMPRLFNQPWLTLASAHSISSIPSRTIDLILAYTQLLPPLPLPPGWLDAVEVGGEAFPERISEEEFAAPTDTGELLVEIHTVGDLMIRLKLGIKKQATIQEQRRLLVHFIELPVIPFRLEAGGFGFINPSKIGRVTIYPAIEGLSETALQADLLQCIRS